MIQTTLIRPFQEGDRVRIAAFQFALGLVRRLEGNETADKLDVLALSYKQGRLSDTTVDRADGYER